MKSSELRDLFLNYFEKNGHTILPSAPLVPQNDDSTLFTSAGMQPLSKYLNGSEQPPHTRLTDSQICLRTNDLEEVGDDTHLTLFEMLGSWSVGDYSKEDAIKFAHGFLTSEDGLNIPQAQLWVTVFEGGDGVPKDDEAAQIWQDHDMPEDRIAYLPAEDNWWSAGETGLCGPDTEVFFDTKFPEPVPEGQNPGNDPEGRFVEIWNSVFMSYDRKPDGRLEGLPSQNVDQGAGLERLLATVNGTSIYETDCFAESYNLLKNSVTNKIDDEQKSLRIIADHMRSALFILSETPQIYPGNQKHGYILRHIIRHAVEHADDLGIDSDVLAQCLEINSNLYKNQYPQVGEALENKQSIFKGEQEKFEKILKRAPTLVAKFTNATGELSGDDAHTLVSAHGIPIPVIKREASRTGIVVDLEGFRAAREKHRVVSRGNAPRKHAHS